MCFGFASFDSGVSSPNFQVYLSGGVPPSTSALNSTVSGACPSSGVPSAQARSGAASSSALPAAAAVVVGAALLGAIVVVAFGASLLPPPPQPARASGSARARAARAGQRRVMQGPPWSGFAERRRIRTDDPDAVNLGGRDALAALAAPPDADALVVFFAGVGRESHPAGDNSDDPWSNYTGLSPPARAGRATFDEACVIAEKEVYPLSSFGVLCHEFGHLLGLPELYAPRGHAQA